MGSAKQWKNGRLREFQVQLLERMTAARNGSDIRESRLGIVVKGHRCLLDLREAVEIIHPVPITPVPLTQDWYLGLVNVRGSLISVIDIDHFYGAPRQLIGTHSRVVVLRSSQSDGCGFLVSAVLGLRYLQEMRVSDSATDAPMRPFIRHYVDRDQRDWREISLAAVIEDVRFLHVGLGVDKAETGA